jgi:predicted TIM-barrel fold metal-dependent hydrolase
MEQGDLAHDVAMKELVISADSHVVEPYDLWVNALGRKYGDRVPHLMSELEGRKGNYFFAGREVCLVEELVNATDQARIDELVRAGHDPAFRLELIDADGVAVEVVNPTWTLYAMRIVDGEIRRACCRVFNDWLIEYCSEDRRRLIGVGAIPIDDVEWGVEELERISARGLRGAMVATRPPEGASPYRDRAYDPFWAAAEALGIPITLHIVTGRVRDPFTYHGEEERGEVPASFIELFNEAGPVLASDFVFGRIFDRFPRLRLVLSEYDASWLPLLAYRLERIESFPGMPRLDKPARAYLKENLWAGIIKDPLAARLRHDIGVDRIMWGSDFPHPPCTYPRTKQVLDGILAEVTAEERHQIVAGNVMRLYDIAP